MSTDQSKVLEPRRRSSGSAIGIHTQRPLADNSITTKNEHQGDGHIFNNQNIVHIMNQTVWQTSSVRFNTRYAVGLGAIAIVLIAALLPYLGKRIQHGGPKDPSTALIHW